MICSSRAVDFCPFLRHFITSENYSVLLHLIYALFHTVQWNLLDVVVFHTYSISEWSCSCFPSFLFLISKSMTYFRNNTYQRICWYTSQNRSRWLVPCPFLFAEDIFLIGFLMLNDILLVLEVATCWCIYWAFSNYDSKLRSITCSNMFMEWR